VKSNIGHLESAAGIAGVTKILLQMAHRTLVPSLHSEVLNPHIEFAKTPFKVQQGVSEWRRPIIEVNGEQREYPRIAGISSFGAGGANAHVIIEEYCAAPDEVRAIEISSARPALIVLSAKSEERLQEQAKQLLAHVAARAYADRDLADMAYTLQVGREAMEHRLAFTAASLAELQEKLGGYLAGKVERGEIEECYRGEVKKNKEALSIFNADDALQLAIATWVEQGKYAKLLELWARGLSFDWTQLYGERSTYATAKPQRISLPSYPFAKERYWVPSDDRPRKSQQGDSQQPSFNYDELEKLFEDLVADQVPQSVVTEKLRLVLSA
jgi:acyl transferase domain-containing protein